MHSKLVYKVIYKFIYKAIYKVIYRFALLLVLLLTLLEEGFSLYLGCLVWRDRVDVPSECTIVRTVG